MKALRIALIVLALALTAGCQRFKAKATRESAVLGAQVHLETLAGKVETASNAVKAARPHVDAKGLPNIDAATGALAEAAVEAATLKASLVQAKREQADANQAMADADARAEARVKVVEAKYDHWYVRTVMWCAFWIKWLLVGWFIFCALCIWAQLNPIAITARVIKVVGGIIPLTYFASRIGKRLRTKRATKS